VGCGDIATSQYVDHRVELLEHRVMRAIDERARQTTVTMVGLMLSQTAILMTLILATR